MQRKHIYVCLRSVRYRLFKKRKLISTLTVCSIFANTSTLRVINSFNSTDIFFSAVFGDDSVASVLHNGSAQLFV